MLIYFTDPRRQIGGDYHLQQILRPSGTQYCYCRKPQELPNDSRCSVNIIYWYLMTTLWRKSWIASHQALPSESPTLIMFVLSCFGLVLFNHKRLTPHFSVAITNLTIKSQLLSNPCITVRKSPFINVNFTHSIRLQSKEDSSKVNISLEAFDFNFLILSPLSATARSALTGPIDG